MKEPRFIIEKNISEKTVKKDKSDIDYHNGFRQGYWESKETPKTPEQLKAINLFNVYLQQEQIDLGLEPSGFLNEENIHIVNKEVYENYFSDSSNGESDRIAKDVVISFEKDANRIKFYEVLLHEMTHAVSHYDIYIKKDYITASSGLSKPSHGEDMHFTGLNEFVTQSITMGLLTKHMDTLINEFKVTKEEIAEYRNHPFGYNHIFGLFKSIIENIAKEQNINTKDAMSNFKRSYFTGSLYNL